MMARGKESGGPTADVLRIAAWFALATGFVEGAGFLVLQQLRWLNWNRVKVPVAPEILWIAPFADLLLFGLLGGAFVLVGRFLPGAPIKRYTFLVCSVGTFYDWLGLSGYLYDYAIASLALGLGVVVTRWAWRHEAPILRGIRASLLALAAAALLTLGGVQGGQWIAERAATARLPTAVPGAPNILVIVVDALRADHLSTYGYRHATSPNLDRLAERGVLFENAISTSSWTLPAHASLVTGYYTHDHQAEKRPLDDRYPTIGEALRARGYRTGAFSGNVLFFNRRQGFGRGFLHFEDYFQSVSDSLVRTLYGRMIEKYLVPRLGFEDLIGRKRAPDINAAVLGWIDQSRNKPFFAFLNYFDVHDPYLSPQPYRSMFSKAVEPGGLINQDIEPSFSKITAEQLQSESDDYDGGIAYTDYYIGELFSALGQRGLLDNTVVVVTSDHGESFGEHGLVLHQNALYWELIHVPLIIARPGNVPAGVRVTRPVSNAALPTTIMALVGAGNETGFPEQSLTHFWGDGNGPSDWPSPVAELAQFIYVSTRAAAWLGARHPPAHYGAMKSVVSADWHYIFHDKFGVELYDWRHDPGELENLAQKPEFQDIVTEFGAHLLALAPASQPGVPSAH